MKDGRLLYPRPIFAARHRPRRGMFFPPVPALGANAAERVNETRGNAEGNIGRQGR